MLTDTYSDVLPKLYGPVFASDAAVKEASINEAFEKHLPAFLDKIEVLLRPTGFLVGDNLTTADFWIGGMYTNFFINPLRYAPERWDATLAKYPNFAAYGQRFAEANSAWLNNPARG